jgi:hypothetical protein
MTTPISNSFEDFKESVQRALSTQFRDSSKYRYPTIEATFEDRVVFSVSEINSPDSYSSCCRKLFSVPYELDGKGNAVLGETTPVKLTVEELSESVLEEGAIPSLSLALSNDKARQAFILSAATMAN